MLNSIHPIKYPHSMNIHWMNLLRINDLRWTKIQAFKNGLQCAFGGPIDWDNN